jgi:hypothetical protein
MSNTDALGKPQPFATHGPDPAVSIAGRFPLAAEIPMITGAKVATAGAR